MTREAGRVILVTNRAPTTFARRGDRLRVSRGAGGVVTALRHLVRWLPVTWIAVASGEGDLVAAQRQPEHGGLLGTGRLTLRLTPIGRELFADYYGEFSSRVLWFLQHGLWGERIQAEDAARLRWLADRYARANAVVAEAVLRELHRPGHSRIVLLHDLHLYQVPSLLRGPLAGARLSHFVHVPWPGVAVWREALPDALTRTLVAGLLGADVVGFQDAASRTAFTECVATLFSEARVDPDAIVRSGRRTLLRVRPVSIDPSSLRPRAGWGERARSDGRLLVVRVDRADPIKNIPAGFAAFERLLERRPELAGRVRFLARLVPSRLGLPEYAREWERTVAWARRLNERFGDGTVVLHARSDRGRGLAELAAADVVLVNSRADGMNLVAKEAAVLNRRLALVLSRTVGAYAELGDAALGIDPNDVEATAAALGEALDMPEEERRSRADRASAAVRRWTARDWLRAQLDDLEEAASSAPALVRAS
jgi:trehalose 6-phosphate synthase